MFLPGPGPLILAPREATVVVVDATVTAVVALSAGAAPAASVTAQYGTDTFESRADGTLGTPWVTGGTFTMPTVASGEVYANTDTAVPSESAFNPVAIGPDTQVTVTFTAATTSRTLDVYARVSAAFTDYYTFRLVGGNWQLRRCVSGTEATVNQVARSQAITDIQGLRITCVGSTITGYANVLGTWTQVITGTDSNVTGAGYPGFGTARSVGGGTGAGIEDVTWGTPSGVDATVTAVPALATGSVPVASATETASSTVTAVVAQALGSAPAAAVSGTGSATVTAVPATALGSAPPANSIISSVVNAPAVIALGSAPVAVISSAGNATVTAVPATGLGSAPVGVLSGAQTWVAVVAAATGAGVAASISAGATVTAVVALAAGQAPRPTITPAPASGGVSGDVAATFAEASS